MPVRVRVSPEGLHSYLDKAETHIVLGHRTIQADMEVTMSAFLYFSCLGNLDFSNFYLY